MVTVCLPSKRGEPDPDFYLCFQNLFSAWSGKEGHVCCSSMAFIDIYLRYSVYAEARVLHAAVSSSEKDFSYFMCHDRPICGALLLHMVAVMTVICKELEK